MKKKKKRRPSGSLKSSPMPTVSPRTQPKQATNALAALPPNVAGSSPLNHSGNVNVIGSTGSAGTSEAEDTPEEGAENSDHTESDDENHVAESSVSTLDSTSWNASSSASDVATARSQSVEPEGAQERVTEDTSMAANDGNEEGDN